MKNKGILFTNKSLTPEAYAVLHEYKAKQYMMTVCDGSASDGFQEQCSIVVMMSEFPHVVKWCKAENIEYVIISGQHSEDAVTEEKPKPKTRTPKATATKELVDK